jgi:hypothetical protein
MEKVSSQEQEAIEVLLEKAREITDDEKFLQQDNFLRVLRAREFNLDDAFLMWQKWFNWRVEYRADEISEDEMMPHIVTGKAFFQGVDKMRRPCLIVRFRYHNPEQFPLEETMRYMIYLVECGVKLADQLGSGQICVIYDRGGLTSANRDNKLIELVKKLSAMLQDFYAERLGAVYVLHVNWFYWLMYQIAKPLLNKKTRGKINIVRNVQGLKEFFDSDQLLVEYEGSNTYNHPYP